MAKNTKIKYQAPEAAVVYELNVRQLTSEGTFHAAIPHLETLRWAGVDIIWVMPPYPIGQENRKGTLGSYYSVRDYCGINPEFGTMKDFDEFVACAHSLGMKVILDWVANHTARDARWITEKPADWYVRNPDGSAAVPFDWTDTAKLNYDNREVWQGQLDAMMFWVRDHHIDGFRCDMAMLVPAEFWQFVCAELRKLRPDLFMLAEAEGTEFFDRAFNACYAWKLHHLLCDIAKSRCRADALRRYLYEDFETYPKNALRLMFTSNHDENSWNGSEFLRFGDAADAMAAATFLLPASLPLIYTGQEFGYDHSFAFFEHDPLPDREPNAFTDLYRRLADMRHSNPALWAGENGGDFTEIHNNAQDCMLSFARTRDNNMVLCLLNLSPYTIQADFNTGIYAGEYTDALNGTPYTLPQHIDTYFAPWEYKVLIKK